MLIAQWNILNRASDGWEAKGAVLADALVRRGVDAACLQEVPADGLDALAAAFAERGLTLAAGRLRQGRTDLCAVCWRTGALEPVGGPSGVPGVDCAIQAFDGLAVCSYHGAWGAFRQRERLDEARLLDARLSRCAAKGAVLLCGDFNAMLDEPAIRLLSGLSEAPTFWTEAQDTAAMLGRGGPYPTVLPGTSAEAAVTARSQGLDPRLVPGRRIDYMFSYGWNYGRPGGWTGGGVRGGRRSVRPCVADGGDAGPGRIAHIGHETAGRVVLPLLRPTPASRGRYGKASGPSMATDRRPSPYSLTSGLRQGAARGFLESAFGNAGSIPRQCLDVERGLGQIVYSGDFGQGEHELPHARLDLE